MSYLIQDAGHGGKDSGATFNGNIEKEYTLEAALYINKRLKELGLENDCTRTTDITLSNDDRTAIVKKYKYCISHHFNAAGGSGAEAIHSLHSDGKFENLIIEEFKKAGYPIRPTAVYSKKNSQGKDWYFMHRDTGSCKTTIVEYEFVDGLQSEKIKDKSYREGMYECVVRAACEFHGIEYVGLEPDYKALYEIILSQYQNTLSMVDTQKVINEKLLDKIERMAKIINE